MDHLTAEKVTKDKSSQIGQAILNNYFKDIKTIINQVEIIKL